MKLTRKSNGIWRINYRDANGQRRRFSTGTKSRSEADRIAARIMHEGPPKANLRAVDFDYKDPNAFTIGMAFARCMTEVWRDAKSQSTLRSNIKLLNEAFGADTPVTHIDYDRIMEVVVSWRAGGFAEATIRRKLETLSAALRECTIWKDKNGATYLIAKPVFPRMKIRNIKDRYLLIEEEILAMTFIADKKVSSGDPRWTVFEALIVFLIDTGVRLGEALNVQVSDIEQDLSLVSLSRYETKTDKPRKVPLSPRIQETLPALIEMSPDGSLFPLTRNVIWRWWKEVRTEVPEIADVNLHILRHTCATRLLRGGMALHMVSTWLGHSNLETTKSRYGHHEVQDLQQGIDILVAAAVSRPPLKVVK